MSVLRNARILGVLACTAPGWGESEYLVPHKLMDSVHRYRILSVHKEIVHQGERMRDQPQLNRAQGYRPEDKMLFAVAPLKTSVSVLWTQ